MRSSRKSRWSSIDWDSVGLGTAIDLDISRQTGASPATVRRERCKRGIPPFDPVAAAGGSRQYFTSQLTPNGDCLDFTSSNNQDGYGTIWWEGAVDRAHRVSWKVHFGPIPPDLLVFHACDRPPCCNPKHLFLGTNADNSADKVSKGRAAMKMRPEDVLEIRRLRQSGMKLREVAEKFSISQAQVSLIARHLSRGHL